MSTTLGLVLIEGIELGDLTRIGLYPTEVTAPGRRVLLGHDPAAAELDGGVLLLQGHTDIVARAGIAALTFGREAVAVGIDTSDNTHILSVIDRDGSRRHVVDTMEDPAYEVGRPLRQEAAYRHLDTDSALELFEQLTGLTLAQIEDATLTMLRSAQEQDDALGIPLLHKVFGLRSSKGRTVNRPASQRVGATAPHR